MKTFIRAVLLAGLLLSELAFGQVSSAPPLLNYRGTTLPSTCSTGRLFFKTDATAGSQIYTCSAANTWTQVSGAGGSGTVTSVSVTTVNGVSGSVATATTTPAISLTLGAITPSSVTATGTVADAIGDVRLIPQNSQSAAYTTVLSDCGKHIFHPDADTIARTFTIAANSSVAAPIGCAITVVNGNGAGVISLAITTDTLRLSGGVLTGTRSIAANCVATALKVTTTIWYVSGGACLT